MKLLRGYVNWYRGYANEPMFCLTVDKLPDFSRLRFAQRNSYFFSELDGYVRFYSYSRPGNGFGGATIPITLADETPFELLGPWSGNSASANRLGFPPSIEVSIHDRDTMPAHGAVTIDWLKKYIHLISAGAVADVSVAIKVQGHRYSPCIQLNTSQGVITFDKLSTALLL